MGAGKTGISGGCLFGTVFIVSLLVGLWSVSEYDIVGSAPLTAITSPDPDPYVEPGLHRGRRAARCPPLQLTNGRIKMKNRKTIAYFKCKKRFELIGQKISTCLSGRWSNPTPVCVRSGCGPPTVAPPMRFRYVYQNSVAQFMCPYGYTRHGPLSIFCDGKRWNQRPPLCTRNPTTLTTTAVTTTTETEPTSSRTTAPVTRRATPQGPPALSTGSSRAPATSSTMASRERQSKDRYTSASPTAGKTSVSPTAGKTSASPTAGKTSASPATDKRAVSKVKQHVTTPAPKVPSTKRASETLVFGTSDSATVHTPPHPNSLKPDVNIPFSSNQPLIEIATHSPVPDHTSGLHNIVTKESPRPPGDTVVSPTAAGPHVVDLGTNSSDIDDSTNATDIAEPLGTTEHFDVTSGIDSLFTSDSRGDPFGQMYNDSTVTDQRMFHNDSHGDPRGRPTTSSVIHVSGGTEHQRPPAHGTESSTGHTQRTSSSSNFKFTPVYGASSSFGTEGITRTLSAVPTLPTSRQHRKMSPKPTSNTHKSTVKGLSKYFITRGPKVTPDTQTAHSTQRSHRGGLFVGLVIAAVVVCAAILVLGAWAARWLYRHRITSYTLSKREQSDQYVSVPYREAPDTTCTKESDM